MERPRTSRPRGHPVRLLRSCGQHTAPIQLRILPRGASTRFHYLCPSRPWGVLRRISYIGGLLDKVVIMRRRTVVFMVSIVVTVLAAGFFLLPVAPTPNTYVCHGGLGCVHTMSLSCVALGFGAYTIYSGRYFLTDHCPFCGNALLSNSPKPLVNICSLL